ncbi:MAG: DUF3137 domain-containing protein [Syntrophorhabdales bacterium]|nr:DUF3137 domain-containing protein [Syntrophorhabdales bacterium]
MKDLNDFRQFYKDQLAQIVDGLESIRNQAASRKLTHLAITGAVFILMCLGILIWTELHKEMYDNRSLFFVFAFIICLIGFSIATRNCFDEYLYRYKDETVGNIITFIEPSLRYNPDGFIPIEHYRYSNLFEREPDRYTGSDMVWGMVGNTTIQFSQIHAEEEEEDTRTDEDGHTHTDTYWVTIFKGFLFVADFNKDFNHPLILSPRKRGNTLMENPEFHRYFSVYGEDPIETRYILSTSLMRRLVHLREIAEEDISVSFVPPYIYVAFPCETLFSPPKYKRLDYELMETYFWYLYYMIGIVDILGLNTRIWSKQAPSVS